MRRRLVRMFPNVPDITGLLQKRQREATNARHGNSPENSTSDSESQQNEDQNVCMCQSERSRSSETRDCPIRLDPMSCSAHPDLAIRRAMEYYACYLPNTDENYSCELVHLLALSGQNKEKEFLEHIDSAPESAIARDSAHNTPLILACAAYNPSTRVIETLLASASHEYVNAENEYGLTALHFAVLNNRPDYVAMLLRQKANPNAGRVKVDDKYVGLTPVLMCLLCRSIYSSVECLEILLRYNPDLNVTLARPLQANDGVHFFAECGCGGCSSRKMLSHTNLVPPSKIGRRPLGKGGDVTYLAVRFGYIQDAEMLLDKHQENGQLDHVLNRPTHKLTHSLFTVAAEYIHPEMMMALLRRRESLVNVVAPGWPYGRQNLTTLHMLLSKQRYFKNEYLCLYCGKRLDMDPWSIENVFNLILDCPSLVVTAANDHSETPLSLACKRGHDYVCEKLLDLKADPWYRDSDGNDSVTLAMMNLETDVCLKVLQILFKTGLAHDIFRHEIFPAGKIVSALFKKQDCEVLKLFWEVGALSETNRMLMLEEMEKPVNYMNEKERKRAREFETALRQHSPPKLAQQVVLNISRSVGYDTPRMRSAKVRAAIRDMADDDGDRVVITEADSEDGQQSSNVESPQVDAQTRGDEDVREEEMKDEKDEEVREEEVEGEKDEEVREDTVEDEMEDVREDRVEDVREDVGDTDESNETPENDGDVDAGMDIEQLQDFEVAWSRYGHLFETLGLK